MNATTSKADEMKLLAKMKRMAGEGSYLSGLFSAKLMEWIEREMADDLSCDIMAHTEWLIEQEREEHKRWAATLEAEANNLRQGLSAITTDLSQTRVTLATSARLLKETKENLASSQSDNFDQHNIIVKLSRDWQDALSDKNVALAEINRLKILLFDLSEKLASKAEA
jgi:septal ring factor EnvC (AmiA/AmiB activator)